MSSVFISHSIKDKDHGETLRGWLQRLGYRAETYPTNLSAGDSTREAISLALRSADVHIVLLGPETRHSQWIDWEISEGMSASAGKGSSPASPCALLAIVLPHHEDFGRPYYDPENVPARLHDALRWESALLRKWSEDPVEIRRWIEEAESRRRLVPRPRTSFAIQEQLESLDWQDSIEQGKRL
jgi:hypothetical protein